MIESVETPGPEGAGAGLLGRGPGSACGRGPPCRLVETWRVASKGDSSGLQAKPLRSRPDGPDQGREGAPLPRLPEPPLQRGRLASTRRARHPQGFRHRVLRHYLNGQTLSLVWRVPGTQVSHSFRPHKVAVKNEVLCPPLTSSAQRSRLPRQSKTTLELVPWPASVSWCPGPHTAHARTSPDFP